MAARKKYFGTDGIRAAVGNAPMTPEFVLRLGWAAGTTLARRRGDLILVGKDTRASCDVFEAALQAGLTAAGVDVGLVGVLPTPGVAHLTRVSHAAAGIVISASHNPYSDNGIKFFSSEGVKLSDALELEIESALERRTKGRCEVADAPGTTRRIEDAEDNYANFCRGLLPASVRLSGLRLIVDCAHGATWRVAPRVYRSLGAEVATLGAEPDGCNVNRDCGTVSPGALQRAVAAGDADLGIAFDGDGDRVLMVTADGRLVDGDELLFIIADGLLRKGALRGGVVGTEMSNLGLETALRERGIGFARAAVGDRHVAQMMHAKDWRLGGEPAGHIICLDCARTGDAIGASLLVLRVLVENRTTLDAAAAAMHKYPQVLVNVPLRDGCDYNGGTPAVAHAVASARAALGGDGRVLVRASGTEPLLRIMVEAHAEDACRLWAERIADEARRALGA